MEKFITAAEGLPLHHFLTNSWILFGLLMLCFVAVLIDLFDGLRTAKALKERIHSHKLRVTMGKIIEYWSVVLLAFLVDCVGCLHPAYALPYVSMIVTIGVLLIEGKSMIEHARRRKSRTAKLPAVLREIAEFLGDAEIKGLLTEMARRKLEESETLTEQ